MQFGITWQQDMINDLFSICRIKTRVCVCVCVVHDRPEWAKITILTLIQTAHCPENKSRVPQLKAFVSGWGFFFFPPRHISEVLDEYLQTQKMSNWSENHGENKWNQTPLLRRCRVESSRERVQHVFVLLSQWTMIDDVGDKGSSGRWQPV